MQKIKAVISEKLLAAYKKTSKSSLTYSGAHKKKNTHIGYKTAYEKHRTMHPLSLEEIDEMMARRKDFLAHSR